MNKHTLFLPDHFLLNFLLLLFSMALLSSYYIYFIFLSPFPLNVFPPPQLFLLICFTLSPQLFLRSTRKERKKERKKKKRIIPPNKGNASDRDIAKKGCLIQFFHSFPFPTTQLRAEGDILLFS